MPSKPGPHRAPSRPTRDLRLAAAALELLAVGVALIALVLAADAGAQAPPPAPEQQILAVVQASEDAWNAGDLVGFMDAYVHSDSLRFAGGGNVTYGWQNTLDRYRAHYTDRALMGTLAFTDLDVTMLGPESALVFGRWQLQREKDRPHGLTTLVFRRRDGHWRIVHDHSSSAD